MPPFLCHIRSKGAVIGKSCARTLLCVRAMHPYHNLGTVRPITVLQIVCIRRAKGQSAAARSAQGA